MSLQNKNNDKPGLVSAFDQFIDNVVDFVEGLFRQKKVDLDEFASKSSGEIDKIILSKMQEGSEFVAGRFKLIYISDISFKFSFEFYLKNPNEKDYLNFNGESKFIPMTRLQDKAREDLKLKKEIIYEIEEPKSGKYSQVVDKDKNAISNINEERVSLSENMNKKS